jgi:hypothetical protein
LVQVAQGVAAGFIWPPRPGSCSTAHWVPPTSVREVAKHRSDWEAQRAQIDAKIQAEKEAKQAEARRRSTPSLLTDDELRQQAKASREWAAIANEMNAKALGEMGRRGLIA